MSEYQHKEDIFYAILGDGIMTEEGDFQWDQASEMDYVIYNPEFEGVRYEVCNISLEKLLLEFWNEDKIVLTKKIKISLED